MVTKKLSCTIKEETMDALETHCEQHDATKSKVVDRALVQFLKGKGVLK